MQTHAILHSMRRMLTLIAVLVPAIAFAQISPFLDVLGHPHAAQVEFLHSRGIVQGYGYGIFRPDINLNRAEFLKILMLAVYGDQALSTANKQCFTDFIGEEQWYWVYACTAKEKGIIEGYPDGTFRGTRKVILAEALKMSIDAWQMRKPAYPNGPPNWYDPYFDVGASRRIFDEFPYSPGHLLTRSEMAVLLVSLGQPMKSVIIVNPPQVDDDLPDDDPPQADADDDFDWPDLDDDDDDFNFGDDDDDDTGPLSDCGNGVLDMLEICDDGNIQDGDGCSSICVTENGWTCSLGICNRIPSCGNGVKEGAEQCDDGNTVDGDGCSSICVIVTEPIRHAALRVEQRPTDSQTITTGANNVMMFAFDAIAGRQDVFLTGVTFRSDIGTMADAENFRVLVDMNGDGITETFVGNASAQGEKLTFTGLYVPIFNGEPRRLELIADISSNASSSSLAIGFDTSEIQYITAVGVDDGRELAGIDTDSGGCAYSLCWIAVFTLNSVNPITVNNQGNLFVTQDTIPVRSHQIRAGELSEQLLRIKMRAKGENVLVTDIVIAGGNSHIDQLEIFEEGNPTAVAIARTVTCATSSAGLFCAKPNLIVPRDLEKSFLVRAFVRPDSPADASGNPFSLYLTSGISPQPAIKARGIESNKSLNQNDGNLTEGGEIFIGKATAGPNVTITGPTHDIVASSIVSVTNAHSDPDGSSIPVGNMAFASFRFRVSEKVSSDSFPVHIRDLSISVLADGVQIDSTSVVIFNNLNPNVTKGCTASATTGNIVVNCSNLENSALNTTIYQGTSVELGLRMTITRSQMNPGVNTLQASLRNLGNRSSTGTVEWDDGSTTFEWVDVAEQRVGSTLYRNE